MSDKIKIGIIGVGSISECHINAYLKNPKAELYAFCDINEARLKKMGEKYGITRLFTKKEDMLALKEIDAVSVCTWNSEHAPCTIAALNAGKHVLCEKPMAMNAIQAEEMRKTAEKNGKLLMVGFVKRYGNDCELVKKFIDNGDIGDVYYTKACYLRRNGNPEGWFGDKARSGGGPLIDLGVHVIDFVRYVSGNPKPVSVYGATYQKLFNRDGAIGKPKYVSAGATGHDICDVEDMATALVRFDNGMTLSVEAAFCLNIKDNKGEMELFGTKAGIKIMPEVEIYGEMNHYLTNVSFDAPTAEDGDEIFGNEINHYIDCITDKNLVCKSPAEDGIELMKILDAIYESAKTGHEVLINKEA